MGIETSPELGGAGCSFTSAILAIEGALWSSSLVALLPRAPSRAASVFARSHSSPAPELAKVDASVSVLCDVHNTLVRLSRSREAEHPGGHVDTQVRDDQASGEVSAEALRVQRALFSARTWLTAPARLVLPVRARIWVRRVRDADQGHQDLGRLRAGRLEDVRDASVPARLTRQVDHQLVR